MQKGAECTHIKWSTAFVGRLWVDGGGGGGRGKKFACALRLDLHADLHHLRPAFLRWPAHSHALPFSVHASLQHAMSQVSV